MFAVGDRVTATVMIDGHDADDWPYVIYCKKGDELEIRECRPNGWYVVAHPHLEPGAGFMARHRELSPANTGPLAAVSSIDDCLESIDSAVRELLKVRDKAGRWSAWAEDQVERGAGS